MKQDFLVLRCVPHGPIPSVADISPLLGWHEREISDLFGLKFTGHPEPYRLVLHSGASPVKPPFDRAYPTGTPMPLEAAEGGVPEVESADVQRLPFGPVRADVVESVELIFFYVGEHILHLHPQLFFKHRGMEKRFEGRSLAHGVVLAERVSGVDSFAHGLCFCQAVECAAKCVVPPRALMLRSLLAELERLYNHLHYLGHLSHTTTLKVSEAEGKLLEERAKQINGRLTGSRFLRGLLIPGGLRRDLSLELWLSQALKGLRKDVAFYAAMLENTNSHLDRLITTGILSQQVAFDQGATGPIDRASGLDQDLRRDHPYAAYGELPLTVPLKTSGDAHARAQVRIAEIDASIALIQRILLLLAAGPVCVDLSSAENPLIAVCLLGAALMFRQDGLIELAGLAWTVALLHLAGHALAKGAMFLAADGVYRVGNYMLVQRGSLARSSWIFGLGALFAAMSLAAMPPQAGFASEWYLFQVFFQGFHLSSLASRMTAALAGAGLALTVAIAFAIFIKLFAIGLLGRAERSVVPMPTATSVAVGVLGSLVLALTAGMPIWLTQLAPLSATFDSDAPSKMADGWLLVPLRSDSFPRDRRLRKYGRSPWGGHPETDGGSPLVIEFFDKPTVVQAVLGLLNGLIPDGRIVWWHATSR